MEIFCKTTQIWPILNCLPSKGKGWGGRELKKLELKVLGSNVMFLPLGNKKYRLRGQESYLALQDKREDGDKGREGG